MILIICLIVFFSFMLVAVSFFYKLYAGCKKIVDARINMEVKTMMVMEHKAKIICQKSQLLERRFDQYIEKVEQLPPTLLCSRCSTPTMTMTKMD